MSAPTAAELAEQSVLGALLLDNTARQRINGLAVGCFATEQHRAIYMAICDALDDSGEADTVGVYARLEASGMAERAGGLAYLHSLSSNTPSAANVAAYAAEVERNARRRKRLVALREAIAAEERGDDAAAREALERAAKLAEPTPAADAPLASKTLADFLAERTTIEYVVDDVLVRGFVYTLTGCTGAGKTAVAVVLALTIDAGRKLGRHETQRGPVVYVAGENPADVRSRFAVALQEMRIDKAAAYVHVVDRSFILAERADELQRIVESVGAVLVIVDTDQAVSLSATSEENDNAERMAHAKRVREITRAKTRPTVLDLCHPRKNAGRDDLTPRGGSSFLNEVDGNLCLWRDADASELFSDPNKFRGAPVAMNFAKHLVESDAVRDTKGRRIGVPYYRLIDDDEADRNRKAEWKEENRLIFVMHSNPSGTQSDWARECQWITDGDAPAKYKVQRLLRRLEKAKPALVKQSRAGRWVLTEAGKNEAKKP